MTETALRMGLVGTGYWADTTHATAVGVAPSWQLSAVWGRDAARATALAERHGAPHSGVDFDAFLAEVDAVTFAVPPHLQAELAVRAIEAGKHVALEKPIALEPATAQRIVDAAEAAGVATIVMFTMMFDERMRAITAAAGGGKWQGGAGLWLGSALNDTNPFNTPWRHEKGALWDVGPHAIAALWRTVGPIREVRTATKVGNLLHTVFGHDGMRTSTCSMTLRAPDPADGFSTFVWGDGGRLELPVDDVDSVLSFTTAYEELAGLIRSGKRAHECDVYFGADVVGVLAAVEQALSQGSSVRVA